MASVNKFIGVGNLGRDPETRYTPSGAAITNASIACTRQWKSKDGQKQEETEWVRLVFFDKLGEIAGQYLKKGAAVYVEGRLKTRKWQDKDGRDVYTTEVVVEQMQMLGGKDREAESERKSAAKPATKHERGASGFDDMDDDLPPF